MKTIQVSSIILLARTETPHHYIFGAYKNNGEATSFVDLPEDHRMFVETLTDEQTVMGFKTLQATPQDFPDAGKICVTHHPKRVPAYAIAAKSIKEGIQIAKERATKVGKEKIYIIGGASIIKQCLQEGLLDEIKLTLVYDHLKKVDQFVYLNFTINKWNIDSDSGILIAKHSKPDKLHYRYYTLKKDK